MKRTLTRRQFLGAAAAGTAVGDPGEKVDLRRKHPDVFTRLKRDYDAWNARMLPKLAV